MQVIGHWLGIFRMGGNGDYVVLLALDPMEQHGQTEKRVYVEAHDEYRKVSVS